MLPDCNMTMYHRIGYAQFLLYITGEMSATVSRSLVPEF